MEYCFFLNISKYDKKIRDKNLQKKSSFWTKRNNFKNQTVRFKGWDVALKNNYYF